MSTSSDSRPSSLLQTLRKSGLASAASLGTPAFINLVSLLNLNQALEACRGCTFFVPVDTAFEAVQAQVADLDGAQQGNLVSNHVGTDLLSD
jgi:hypothetical protein